MSSSTPEPTSRYGDNPAPALAEPPADRAHPARMRPLPRVWVIWLTTVLLGWLCGLGLVIGMIRSGQGIARSRKRNLSPVRYVVPLVFALAVTVFLVVVIVQVWRSPDTGYGFVFG